VPPTRYRSVRGADASRSHSNAGHASRGLAGPRHRGEGRAVSGKIVKWPAPMLSTRRGDGGLRRPVPRAVGSRRLVGVRLRRPVGRSLFPMANSAGRGSRDTRRLVLSSWRADRSRGPGPARRRRLPRAATPPSPRRQGPPSRARTLHVSLSGTFASTRAHSVYGLRHPIGVGNRGFELQPLAHSRRWRSRATRKAITWSQTCRGRGKPVCSTDMTYPWGAPERGARARREQ
jgi:hypothetical protein